MAVFRYGDNCGITHSNSDPDTVNWKGYPVADGICEVSMNPETGILFDWKTGKGDSVENDEVKEYWFNPEENFDRVLQESNALNGVTGIFEIDSRCQKSTMVPRIETKMASDSLLKKGTWHIMERRRMLENVLCSGLLLIQMLSVRTRRFL